MPNKTRNKKSKTYSNDVGRVIKNAPNMKQQKENEVDGSGGQDNEDLSLLGHYITKEYELLRLVLSYLPLRDLYAAAQVCKTWQSAVEVIKRSRHPQPHWLLWHCRQKDFSKEEVPHLMFSRHFYSEPQLCLMFMTRALNVTEINCRRAKAPCPCNREGKRCSMKHRVIHYMRAELHECPCVMVEGYGVVGSSHDLSYTVEVEENFNAYSGILLPKAPGVSVNVFHLTKDECVSLNHFKTVGNQEIELLTGFSSSMEPIRCLLLFCKDRYSKSIEKLVEAFETRQGSKFAVGGGFFDHVNLGSLAPMNEKRHVCVVGIAFSGEGVHAASTVLGADIDGEKQVVEAMEELRACQLPGQESVGFMFACVGRGLEWYLTDNVESACFRHHFPATPLVGFFGAGEIGHQFFPGSEKACLPPKHPRPDDRRSTDDDSVIRSYTTVFVHMSFARQGAA